MYTVAVYSVPPCPSLRFRHIAIVGAGIAGLRAAIAFRKEGHVVDIFAEPPGILVHRSDLHQALKRLAIATHLAGVPATIHLNTAVSNCDPDLGTPTTKDGAVHEADVILGADGVHTALPSKRAAFRCLLAASALTAAPAGTFDWLLSDSQGPRGVRAGDGSGWYLFVYPAATTPSSTSSHPTPTAAFTMISTGTLRGANPR
ncbi:Salicylate hydroxylase [Mycena kentingensis (nom. inval.)]|nr:Salicylate hydroxylase [Mycena kentingensis (nom. inval.)]